MWGSRFKLKKNIGFNKCTKTDEHTKAYSISIFKSKKKNINNNNKQQSSKKLELCLDVRKWFVIFLEFFEDFVKLLLTQKQRRFEGKKYINSAKDY